MMMLRISLWKPRANEVCLSCVLLPINLPAMDARLEVGLEQQAELMLKMMATLHADSILQALTSTSSTGKPTA